MIRFERRAATVLFNMLQALSRPGPVLVPENVCSVVILMLQKLGRTIEPIDVSLQTMGIDHDRLQERWTDAARPAPAALIYVRPYGHVGDLTGLFQALRGGQPDALIIDDRCLAFPDPTAALDDGVDALLYSNGYAKSVELGHGGFAVTRPSTPYHPVPGGYDPQADRHWDDAAKVAIAAEQRLVYEDSDWLDRRPPGSWEEHLLLMAQEEPKSRDAKRRLNALYAQALPVEIQFPAVLNDWRFNIWVQSSELLLAELRSHGLFASSHYRSIAPLVGGQVSAACAATRNHVVNLFNYKYVDSDMVERIIDVLRRRPDLLRPGPSIQALRLGGESE